MTRGATASSSRRVKQDLVRILFGKKYSGKGPEAHRQLDHSIYSYSDLKTAYLQKVQELHPDKQAKFHSSSAGCATTPLFVQLKEAWSRYDAVAKTMRRVEGGEKTEASFVKFGVGCSFSDNDKERAERIEIMDQACKGWLCSGQLGSGSSATSEKKKVGKTAFASSTKSLLHDDYFTTSEDQDEVSTPTSTNKPQVSAPVLNQRRTLLVKNFIRPARN